MSATAVPFGQGGLVVDPDYAQVVAIVSQPIPRPAVREGVRSIGRCQTFASAGVVVVGGAVTVGREVIQHHLEVLDFVYVLFFEIAYVLHGARFTALDFFGQLSDAGHE